MLLLLTEVIVLSDRGSKGIIKGKNGTLELLGIKPPQCNVRNPTFILCHSSIGNCASLRHTDIYTSILNILLHKENIHYGSRSFLSG